MKKQIILKIHGKVQGVFFRDRSQGKARELGLTGSVWNEPDGTVEIVAEGEEKKLKEFMEWCRNGPEHAKVFKIDARWQEPMDQFENFTVK